MVSMMLPSLVPMLSRYREAIGSTGEARRPSESSSSEQRCFCSPERSGREEAPPATTSEDEERHMDKNKESDREGAKEDLPMASPHRLMQQWEAARQQLLVKEKAFDARPRRALAAERRRMPGAPWRRRTSSPVRRGRRACSTCSKGAAARSGLSRLLRARRRRRPEHGCRGCSLSPTRSLDVAHLNARDTTLAFGPRAPKRTSWRLEAESMEDALLHPHG